MLILGQLSIFPLMLFIAYLLVLFSNPVDVLSSDGKTPTFFARLKGGSQAFKTSPKKLIDSTSDNTNPISSTNSAMSGYVTVSLDEVEFNVRVFAGFVINKTEPSSGSFYGDSQPLVLFEDEKYASLYGSNISGATPYDNDTDRD